MTSQLMTNGALIEALKTIIALPKGITSLDLRMRMDEVPTLSITAHVYDSGGNPVIDRVLMQVVERSIVGEVQHESWLEQRARQAHEQVAQWFATLREKHDDAYDDIEEDCMLAMQQFNCRLNIRRPQRYASHLLPTELLRHKG